MTPGPISTARLLLRPLTIDDVAAVLPFRSHPEATRYIAHEPLGPGENRDRILQLTAAAAASSADWFNIGWAIELRSTGEVVGESRTWTTVEPPAPGRLPAGWAGLGYILHPDEQGRGLGREAVGGLVHWLFAERDIQTVVAGVYEPNIPSRRLLEGLGFERDRYFTAAQDTAGKALPSWRYRLDRP